MKYRCLWPLFLTLLTVSYGWAQNDLQANVNLQFRFANPGARAAAMGGAFIGLADDTTAIFANPAGLVQMRSSTLALEGSSSRRKNNIPFYSGSIDQTDLQDFSFNLEERDFPKTTTSVPFLGYVHATDKLRWGVFLAEQANFERQFTTAGVAIPFFVGGREVQRFELEFFPPSINEVDLQMRTLGFSVAYPLTSKLSGGITLNYSRMDYRSYAELQFPNVEELFPDVNFGPGQLMILRTIYGENFAEVSMNGEDQQLSVFAGLLLRPTERFSVGVAYKQQPKFDYDHQSRGRDLNFEWEPFNTGVAQFNVPDSFGVGISFKPTDLTILSLEVNRVLYSELSDDFLGLFANPNDTLGGTQKAADITEYHVGFEHVLVNTTYPISLRAGYWQEPYHALVNTTLDTQILFRVLNENQVWAQDARGNAFLQRFAKDLNHLTAGIGVTFNKWTLDLSADIDDETSSYSLSSIYRF